MSIALVGVQVPSLAPSPCHPEGGVLHRAIIAALVVALSTALLACGGPEGIVREAATAAAAGDRAAYIGCFTPRSRSILRAFYASAETVRPEVARLGAGELIVGESKPMKPGPDGGSRAVVAVAESGHESLALVVHEMAGIWRIDLIDSERVLTGLERAF